jgi:hypothetical protein
MKQPVNQSGKNYITKYSLENNSTEAWSIQRLVLSPKGWLKDFRANLQTKIGDLQSRPEQILHATYATSPTLKKDISDIENTLFYNVGLKHFASLMSSGVRFERCYSYPASSFPLSASHLHYYRYTMEDAHNSFYSWQTTRVVATWENVEIPPSSAKITATNIWYHLHSHPLKILHMPKTPLTQYGLSITVTLPITTKTTLRTLMKPIIDGVVSTFHTYSGAEIKWISQRLGTELSHSPDEIRDLLQRQNQAALGTRRLVYPLGNSYKWNPADDICFAAELFLQLHEGEGWLLSGNLYEIQYCEPFFK